MADNVRVGIVGAHPSNGWAGRAHMPGFLAGVPGAELTAVSTTRQESADEAAAKFGARHAFDDHRKMLELDDVDVVAVVVKLPHHFELAKDIIESGKNIYVEWPLGTTTAQAEELAALAKAKGIHTCVGLQSRKSAEYTHVRTLIDEGYVGEVLSCTLTQFSGGALARPSGRIWMRDNATHANTLSITFGHAMDGLMTMLGPIDAVSAEVNTQVHEWTAADTGERFSVDAPDDILVSGKLKRGGSMAVHVASLAHQGTGYRFEVHGMEGTLVIETAGSPHTQSVALLGAQGDAKELTEIAVPQEPWIEANGIKGQSINIAKLWAAYAKSIQDGSSDFEADFDAAIEHHQFIDAVQRAADTGQRQQV
jgi:predicted dehydrogenase